MRKILVVTLFTAVWSAITILALLYGVFYNFPDNVHTDYGLPLTWATQTTSTFAGPVNLWEVNIANFAVDLAVWLGALTAAEVIIQYVLDRKAPKPNSQ